MNVLVYIETQNNEYKKAGLEALSFASQAFPQAQVIATSISNIQIEILQTYGATSYYNIQNIESTDTINTANALAQIAKQLTCEIVIISASYHGKTVAPYTANYLSASLITNVISLPNNKTYTRGVYSGKAFANVELNAVIQVLTLTPNSFDLIPKQTTCTLQNFECSVVQNPIIIKETKKASGQIPLTEAEIVVSGGRGLKGPENWGLIEEFANKLGAATACSKPVSDMHWRPHSEHVGQTGITIKPNLYFAIGISGAIQHLAGVSSSKTIVVINKDPEAPFFKAADYGIVGDVFEVLPKLTAALAAS